MSSNWLTTTRTSQSPSSPIGTGSATAAAYELNPIDDTGLDNSIFRVSTTKVVNNNLASTPSDEVNDDNPMRDYMNSFPEEFEATMQLSDEASQTSLGDLSTDEEKGGRRSSPDMPHLRDLSVVDPFDPFRKGKKNQTQPNHRPYKVVKGRAPDPPVQLRNHSDLLNRIPFTREGNKRPAPQPPSTDANQWRSGAVEKRVQKVKRRNNEVRSKTVSQESISLTFREKMARFFGLTGSRKKKERSRAMSATFASHSSSDVVYGPCRYGTTKTLQSFSFANSKIYSPRVNSELVMGGGDVDIVRPQANGVVRVQRRGPSPVLQGHEIRWSNRETVFGRDIRAQPFVRRADYHLRPPDAQDAHL